MIQLLDKKYLSETIQLSKLCPSSTTAFAVGASIVNSEGVILSTGYSRELGLDWHAEAVAIHKLITDGKSVQGLTLYTSMEPCSVRKSGKKPCCEWIIENQIARVVFGLREPENFVICQGLQTLQNAGIQIEHLSGFEQQIQKYIL